MSLDDDMPPIAATPAPTPAHVLLAKVDDVTRALHAEGRAQTRRRSYCQGSTLRYAVHQIRVAAGLVPIEYNPELATEERPAPDGSVDVPLPGTEQP